VVSNARSRCFNVARASSRKARPASVKSTPRPCEQIAAHQVLTQLP
jgi:hypothetical protein